MSTFEAVHEPLEPRDVVLGRTTHVRRVLPNKNRRMVGAWCFLDHFGPDDVAETGGMWVPPHPHTGLQTVTWLVEGEGLHTDSLGSHQRIRPGQLNVMTAGHGIAHAEVTPEEAPPVLHGVQLWVCLPDAVRDSTPPDFTHVASLPTREDDGVRTRVLVGEHDGMVSPAPTFSPLVGVEVALAPGARTRVPLDPAFEYGVLTLAGEVTVAGTALPPSTMSYLGDGRGFVDLAATDEALLLLLGGEPFEEEIVMWWNFIGRSHEEMVAQRADWNGDDNLSAQHLSARFGRVADFEGERLLAPPLPNIRLRPRPRATRPGSGKRVSE